MRTPFRLRARAARFLLALIVVATMTPVYGVAGEPPSPAPERRVRAEEPSRARDAWRAPAASLGDASEYVDGEVLVRFKRGASTAARGDAHARVGGQRVRGFDIVPGLELVRLPAGTSVAEAIRSYQRTSAVSYAQPNYRKRIAATVPNDPSFGQLWGLKNTGQSGGTPGADINATDAWDITTGSRDIVVAVIDTGVDYTHPDLAGNMWVNPGEIPGNGIDDDGNGYIDDVYGIDTYNGTSDPADDESHGTHCAGTIGAVGDDGFGVAGVNWNVSIMAIKALDSDGWGTTESVVEAFEYAAAMGADVMSNSWGGDYVFDQAEYDAIAATDALFVFAAGNESANNDSADMPFYPASYDLPNIISVAASTRTDARASFSNIGATTVDVFAPGADILSTIPTGRKTFVPDVAATLYATDFSSLTGWLLSEEGDSQPWALTSTAYTSPPTSLGYTGYEVGDLAYADSPAIDCSAAKSVYLNAKVRYDVEQGADYLDVWVWDGADWRWAGYKTGSSGGEFEDWWIDITPWAAGRNNVQVSFGFDAGGLLGSSGGYEGTYVDDVRVVTPVETTTYFSDNLSTLTKWNTAMYAVNPWGLSTADYVSAPSSAAHTGYQNNELSLLMQSDGVDMSGQDAALLRFKARYDVEEDWDWFGVWTSGSGRGMTESWFTGDSEGWRAQTVVLPEPGVDMSAAFILESDELYDSSDGYEGAYVDDVEWVGLSGTWVAENASEAYEYKNGTSMATPHVAGIAALVLAVAPETDWATLKDLIMDSAEPVPALAGLCVTGARVDAYATLVAATPDITPPVTVASGIPAGWTATDVTVTLSATDNASDIAATYYRIGAGTQQTYSVPFTLMAEGETTLTYWSVDAADNTEPAKTATVRIDKSPPVTGANVEGDGTGSVTVTLTPTDTYSGVDTTYHRLGASGEWQEGTSRTVTVTGSHTLYYYSVDEVGNAETVDSVSFAVVGPDITPPVTVVLGIPTDWTADDVTVTLSATDNASDIAATYYRIGAGTQQTYSAPFTLMAEGETTLTYWSVDAADNTEPAKTATVRIDKSPPVTTTNAAGATRQAPTSFALSPSDTYSGVAATYWSLDAGATWYLGTTVDVAEKGDYTLRYYSVDNVGNSESVKTASFTVTTSYASIAGTDRIATAVAASRAAFPDGADVVVLATARNWPDALGGTALAGVLGGPILLTNRTTLPTATANEIAVLGARHVIIVGGEAAVDPAVRTALLGLLGAGGTVERIWGADRYATANAIALRVITERDASGGYDGMAAVATGGDFPDALAVAPLAAGNGWPLYLAHPTKGLSSATRTAMEDVGEVLVLGGTGAVSAAVESELKGMLGTSSVTRLKGDSRYETAVAIATWAVEEAGYAWNGVAITNGRDFPDALAGGVVQGRARSVMLLTAPTSLSSATAGALAANAPEVSRVTFLGGTAAVSDAVRAAVRQLLD